MIRSFSIQTLGCKVNQYEGEQLAALLRAHGLRPTEPRLADLRIINSCSVTVQAAGKSRQLTRQATRRTAGEQAEYPEASAKPSADTFRPVRRLALRQLPTGCVPSRDLAGDPTGTVAVLGPMLGPPPEPRRAEIQPPSATRAARAARPRVVVTGCWATSDRGEAASLAGVDAVIGHHQDVAAELVRLLALWQDGEETADPRAAPTAGTPDTAGNEPIAGRAFQAPGTTDPTGPPPDYRPEHHAADDPPPNDPSLPECMPKPCGNDGWITEKACAPTGTLVENKPSAPHNVNGNPAGFEGRAGGMGQRQQGREEAREEARAADPRPRTQFVGTTSLPLLDRRQTGRQRAYLKVQDGCDAHCTYCIIPKLRPRLWSKGVEDAVGEARRLVAAGHVELVLTGIFLGAYGQPTALRRRQPHHTGTAADRAVLADLIDALCTHVPGLRRVRLSSLEPGDLTDDLLAVLRSHAQVVPHFHLPLQSGSDVLLRRMNRQYTRGDFLRMIDRVRGAFDRPALTTDIIVGFPGETDEEFRRTLEVVETAAFIHVHAFSYSPRPGTAAARWTRDFVRGPVVNERIDLLRARADAHSLAFRRQFVGETVELLVELDKENDRANPGGGPDVIRHGRCERYFAVHFEDVTARPGDFVRVRVERVSPNRTFGSKDEG